MALIAEVKAMCDRLAPMGWRDLLKQASGGALDIVQPSAGKLEEALGKGLSVDRSVPGFGDYALDGAGGIEAGSPARSLLFHALASPGVVSVNGVRLRGFPTGRELGLVENYVFAVGRRTLAQVKALAGGQALAVVVFASEYRLGRDTSHRKHADIAFSRTGLSRVGTAPALYDPARRGWLPFVDGEPRQIRALPARYSAYLAVSTKGAAASARPMRFQSADSNHTFWIPVHKLFDGAECLAGMNLSLEWSSRHVNEKIRRVHLQLQADGLDSGAKAADLGKVPFLFEKGIAELSPTEPGLLLPTPHPALVEEAIFGGRRLGFKVPSGRGFSSTVNLPASGVFRHGPEFVHARRRLVDDQDLNEFNDVSARVDAGGYEALHYVDFTGDGWVTVLAGGFPAELAQVRQAYSLVTAPDFYPACGQRELTEWAESLAPALAGVLWETPPSPLCDSREAANLQLPDSPFLPSEKTITTVVGLLNSGLAPASALGQMDVLRHSSLPDDAAGVFAPGWDVSVDKKGTTPHLAAYGLGSPFPEDAKLCAALSTFWPGAAPDATRALEPELTAITVSPMTDEEVGQTGALPWDGVPGPRVFVENGLEFAEYARFDQTDYVKNALEGRFSLAITGQITAAEYQDRVLSMALVYLAEKTGGIEKASRLVLSFRSVTPGDDERLAASTEAGTTLSGQVYRFELIDRDSNPRKIGRLWRVRVTGRTVFFVSPDHRKVIRKRPGEAWRAVRLRGV